jgi:cobalt-zinc-cadmium efflux system outer membrane protein
MRAVFFRVVPILSGLAFAGCAMQQYQPAPIAPAETSARLESRSLTDPELRSFVEKTLGPTAPAWPPAAWDLRTLSLAALYFNPALDAARARVQEADAAIVTAGGRPNPALDVVPGVPSPYLLSFDLMFPIETAGKRGYRIQSANSMDEAARFDLADAAWKVRSGVRTALLDYMVATRKSALLAAEEKLQGEQANLLQQRLSVGEIARPELDAAQIAFSQTHLEIVTAQGQAAEARAKLATAIGVPLTALDGIELSWGDLDSPPSAASFSAEQIQGDAVLNRMDVRRALAEYAAAQSSLRLEIAKQYPDLQVGPGYTYEQQQNYFTLGLSVTLPILNRNQGPIAEAEAKRKEAAANFLQTQAQVIAQSEEALTAYTSALRGLTESDQSLERSVERNRLRLVQRAAQLGEEDQFAVNAVAIEGNALDQARLETVAQAQTALGQLEDAVQRPLDPSDAFPNMNALSESLSAKEPNR